MGLKFLRHIFLLTLATLLACRLSNVSAEEEEDEDDFDEELYSVIHSVREGSLWTKARQVRSIEVNQTFVKNGTISDNSLWNDLWYECKRKASFSCIGTGVFKYLDKSFERKSDYGLTDSVFFRSNNNKVYGICENTEEERENCLSYNEKKLKVTMKEKPTETETQAETETEMETVSTTEMPDSNEIEKNDTTDAITDSLSNSTIDSIDEKSEKVETERKEESGGKKRIESLSDLSDILYDKGTHFLMTHDTEFQLPNLFFGGGSVKIEPKSYVEGNEFEEEGALVKIVFKPPPPPSHIVKGRVIHHLKKLFKKKLMHSFMALMLIIKMIKVKLMFLLPMIIGKATAKKLLLKVLLFLIPGLAHLFKLCHYYHMEHAKYHHHHHKIKHHHHHIQVPVPVPVPVHFDHQTHIEGGYDKPTGGGYDYPPYPPSYSGIDNDYDYPSYGGVSHYGDNEAHLSSWGLGSSNYHEAGVLDAKNQPVYYKQQQQHLPNGGYYYSDHLGSHSHGYTNKLNFLTPRPPLGATTVPVTYDPFYSPILQKIDNIFVQMGFNEEPCRERLICSMYKTPHRFSPHSNLLSHEISRDSKDLQKPVMSNTAVLRFYRYVQAARDGQDKKDCLRLYPSCTVNTE